MNVKDFKQLQRRAERQGWRVVHGQKHLKWYSPDGKTLITSSFSPSCYRGFKNHLALMRRGGFDESSDA